MYKCLECGTIFEEVEVTKECIGEYQGAPYREDVTHSPCCSSDYEETKPCKCCSDEHVEEELTNGICEDCGDECFVCGEFVGVEELINGSCIACRKEKGEGDEKDDTE